MGLAIAVGKGNSDQMTVRAHVAEVKMECAVEVITVTT